MSDLEFITGGNQGSLKKLESVPYAVFGAPIDFYIISDQFNILKSKSD